MGRYKHCRAYTHTKKAGYQPQDDAGVPPW